MKMEELENQQDPENPQNSDGCKLILIKIKIDSYQLYLKKNLIYTNLYPNIPQLFNFYDLDHFFPNLVFEALVGILATYWYFYHIFGYFHLPELWPSWCSFGN